MAYVKQRIGMSLKVSVFFHKIKQTAIFHEFGNDANGPLFGDHTIQRYKIVVR